MTEALTFRALIAAYRSDRDSAYCKPEDKGGLRYRTRENYDSMMRRLDTDIGHVVIGKVNGRFVRRTHEQWQVSGTAIAHSLIGMVRTLATFGATMLESADCRALKVLMHDMRFPMAKPRTVFITRDQADAVRFHARAAGLYSIALAQALQFECGLRQKDVIGEWVPNSEYGASAITYRGEKWLRGLRWESVDNELAIRHTTSKRGKIAEPDLKLSPMVIEELAFSYPGLVVSDAVYDEVAGEIITEMVVDRSKLPASGPIIIAEETGRPFIAHKFRRLWRIVANTAGLPKNVQNRDSRAGTATEATAHGSIENVQHLLTHSDLATTQIYARGKVKKARRAQLDRVIGRLRDARSADT